MLVFEPGSQDFLKKTEQFFQRTPVEEIDKPFIQKQS